MAVIKVEGYKASDGKFFDDELEAEEYQQVIEIERALVEIRMEWNDDHEVDAKFLPHISDDVMLEWLKTHRETLHRLLHILDVNNVC